MIYDIAPPISEKLAVWPGDSPPRREVLFDMTRGDNITLSTLHGTVHLGAHADAPSHYGKDAPAIDECALDDYLGPCQVIRVAARRGQGIGPGDIQVPIEAARILLATGTFPDPTHFNEDFAFLTPPLVEYFHDQGVHLVGVDTPSVDQFTSQELPV
ncbi:MAG TPA: cyclase family protein, partial [Chthonomonadales bacterium]|nr:cyclase family protein [Chthonomonadales bacterium]